MSDSLEPPAKRARLEADAPIYGASALDAPGSPVDDLDDDFYDTTPVKPAALATVDGPSALFAAAAPAPASFHLPGLGAVSDTPASQPPAQNGTNTHHDEASEDGELSDNEAFYDDGSAPEQTVANQEQALSDAQQHDAAAVDSPARDTDGELDAALTAAIDLQNDADSPSINGAGGAAGDDAKTDFMRAGEANKDNLEAEWQLDSDASDSDSSSSSSSDADSDEEGSDEGELLDPEALARALMAEVTEEPGAAATAKVKTQNEMEEQYEKPDITVTEDTKITELGKVESIVGNMLLIKGKNSGDFQVIESGSAICLQNRTVIGKISEQLGRVEEPNYSLGFNDPAEIESLGIAKGTPVYYVDEHSTFVFTEPLRHMKHTDASNLHDEEANEVEFSDDEKESEWKREQRAKKRGRADSTEEAPSLPIPTGPRAHMAAPVYQSTEYQGGGLKYSDDEDEDLGMYKPLARPDHFEQIVGHGAPIEDRSHVRRGMMRGRGGWADRGRGFRGRGGFGGRGDFGGGGRGDRGGFGGGRGDFGAGRGDRGGFGQRGDRGGFGNDRGNKGGGDRGGRSGSKGQADRGRQQEQFHDRSHDRQQDNRQRNGPQRDGRSATSASPARHQQDRGHSQVQQDRGHSQSHQAQQQQQQPPAKSGKHKNRKQRQREKRERERQQQQMQQHQQQQQQNQQGQQNQAGQQQKRQYGSPAPPSAPSGPSNTNAYTNNSNAGWPAPYANSNPPQPAASFTPAPAPPPPPPVVAPSYGAPAAYTPQPPAQGAQGQQNQQATLAAWAQWFHVMGQMNQQQQQPAQPPAAPYQAPYQAPVPAPPPPVPAPAPVQPQAQYAYPYAQYAQPAPAAPPQQQQPNAQGGAQSLQDILRALGRGQ